jgi:hypothetical protein
MPKRNEMAELTEHIDNYKYGISSTGLGKALNKVHGDNFPRCRRLAMATASLDTCPGQA